MSAIRPNLPAVTPQGVDQAASSSTLRQAQAAFFRAALGEVQAAPLARTAAQTSAPTRTAAQTAPTPSETGRTLRPGSLLDIKV
jgi:hypothetical protein